MRQRVAMGESGRKREGTIAQAVAARNVHCFAVRCCATADEQSRKVCVLVREREPAEVDKTRGRALLAAVIRPLSPAGARGRTPGFGWALFSASAHPT